MFVAHLAPSPAFESAYIYIYIIIIMFYYSVNSRIADRCAGYELYYNNPTQRPARYTAGAYDLT